MNCLLLPKIWQAPIERICKIEASLQGQRSAPVSNPPADVSGREIKQAFETAYPQIASLLTVVASSSQAPATF